MNFDQLLTTSNWDISFWAPAQNRTTPALCSWHCTTLSLRKHHQKRRKKPLIVSLGDEQRLKHRMAPSTKLRNAVRGSPKHQNAASRRGNGVESLMQRCEWERTTVVDLETNGVQAKIRRNEWALISFCGAAKTGWSTELSHVKHLEATQDSGFAGLYPSWRK